MVNEREGNDKITECSQYNWHFQIRPSGQESVALVARPL